MSEPIDNRTVSAETDNPGKEVYPEKLAEVDRIISMHIRKRLPSVSYMAKRVGLSESTLKRHFKLLHGVSIYQYYLSQKMELAKKMIQEEMLTVNETAERLGYENVSNFIETFKKNHGYSPGALKKAAH